MQGPIGNNNNNNNNNNNQGWLVSLGTCVADTPY